MTEPRAVLAKVEKALLYACEHRLISFPASTAAALLAARVSSSSGLTVDEGKRAWRILHGIRDKLTAAGIELPGGEDTATTPKPARRPQVAIRPDGRIGITAAPAAVHGRLQVAAHAKKAADTQWCLPASPACAHTALEVLADYDPEVLARVQALATERAALPALRQEFLDPTSPVPDMTFPVKRNMWDHQVRAAAFATNTSASMLAMIMGSGKTLATIAAVNTIDHSGRVLICCPNKVRGVWPREVAAHSLVEWHMVAGKRPSKRKGVPPRDLTIVQRLMEAEECLFDCDCGAPIHAAVFNYEMLAHEPVKSWVPRKMLDVIIYDEGHRLKSATGIVSKTAAKWVNFSRQRIGLSGTPTPQHPWDIFGLYRALDPGIFGSTWTQFKRAFVLTRERQMGGGRTQEFPVEINPERAREFADLMHSIMYCPQDIDLDLPPVLHTTREVELEPAARKVYDDLHKNMCADLTGFGDASGDAPMLTPANILSRMLRLMQCTGGTVPDDGKPDELGRIIRDTYRISHAKADVVAEILDEVGCAPGREPVIVYCQFRADLDAVREVAEKARLRYAEISGRRADGLTQESRMTPDVDVVGVQIQSGGTGVDLTRSRVGIWYSTGHSLGDYEQALKRQDRPGQTRPVTFIHLVCPGTIDEQVYSALSLRGSVVAAFLAANGVDPELVGHTDSGSDFDDDFYDSL